MQTETVFKIVFGVWAVLFIMPVARANRKAKLEHGSRIAQSANEYAPLLWVRAIVGYPIWAFLIDWLVSGSWFPWATVSVPLWARCSSTHGIAEASRLPDQQPRS